MRKYILIMMIALAGCANHKYSVYINPGTVVPGEVVWISDDVSYQITHQPEEDTLHWNAQVWIKGIIVQRYQTYQGASKDEVARWAEWYINQYQ